MSKSLVDLLQEIKERAEVKDIGYMQSTNQFTKHSGDRETIFNLLAVISKLIEQRDEILGHARPTSLKIPMNKELAKILSEGK